MHVPPTALIDPAAFVSRVRWVMAAVILFDITITFFGQPATYWTNPATVNEGNKLFHFTMAHGWTTAMLVDAVYVCGSFLLVSVLPWRLALVVMFSLILGHFFGGSTWLCFRYQLGAMGMILYGIVVALLITVIGFRRSKDV